MSADALVEAAQHRRTIYKLGKNSPVPDSKIEELVNAAILNVPSSFNTQSTRLVVLLGNEHERLWGEITPAAFAPLVSSGAVPEETFKNQTAPKLEGFKAAYGTVSTQFLSNWLQPEATHDMCRQKNPPLTHHSILDPLLRGPLPHPALQGKISQFPEPLRTLG